MLAVNCDRSDRTRGLILDSQGGTYEAPPISFDHNELTVGDLTGLFYISILPAEHLKVRQPLPIQIFECPNGYIASLTDANIHSQAETQWEAIDALLSLIVDTFEMLSELDPSSLGPFPTKQLAILKAFIQTR
jgi:hypothetical protein